MNEQGVQLSMTQKVVGGGILALLGWTAWTVQDSAKQIAVLDAKVEAANDLRNRVGTLETGMSAAQERMNSLNTRIIALEQDRRD